MDTRELCAHMFGVVFVVYVSPSHYGVQIADLSLPDFSEAELMDKFASLLSKPRTNADRFRFHPKMVGTFARVAVRIRVSNLS